MVFRTSGRGREPDGRKGVTQFDPVVLNFNLAALKFYFAVMKLDFVVMEFNQAVLKFNHAVVKFDFVVMKHDRAVLKFDRGVLQSDPAVMKFYFAVMKLPTRTRLLWAGLAQIPAKPEPRCFTGVENAVLERKRARSRIVFEIKMTI